MMMKKLLLLLLLPLALALISPTSSLAQTSSGSTSNGHTAQGEAEGKVIWEKLQAKELNCEDLSDDNFHSLGMYFMGLMAGDSHEAMDTMMTQMMGEEGEDQMHIAMGKRLSGCEADAPIPQTMIGSGMIPMMGMMGGGGNSMMGYSGWGNMMTGWGGFIVLFFTLSLIVWLIVGILAAVWLFRQINKK